MGKILYHGTDDTSARNIQRNGVDLRAGRKDVDFGQGFYLTNNYGTARRHAWDTAFRNKSNAAYVLKFELDTINLSIKKFSDNHKWADEIFNQRHYRIDNIVEDMVIGPIADAGIVDLINDYANGNIDQKSFYGQITTKTLGTQFVIKTEKGVQRLKFKGKEKV